MGQLKIKKKGQEVKRHTDLGKTGEKRLTRKGTGCREKAEEDQNLLLALPRWMCAQFSTQPSPSKRTKPEVGKARPPIWLKKGFG